MIPGVIQWNDGIEERWISRMAEYVKMQNDRISQEKVSKNGMAIK